jgi:hypothetical protein
MFSRRRELQKPHNEKRSRQKIREQRSPAEIYAGGAWIQVGCPWRPTKAPTGSAKSERPKKPMTQARKRNQFMTEMLLPRLWRFAGGWGFAS